MRSRWLLLPLAASAAAAPACGAGEAPPTAARRPDVAAPVASVTATAAATAVAEDAPPAAPEPSPPETLDERFVPVIAAAFRDYRPWGRWDDEMRWAPWLCRMPLPGRARMSAAEDGGHARKLYSIFAKERGSYSFQAGMKDRSQPVGQTIIKEAYFPEAVAAEESTDLRDPIPLVGQGDHFHPYVTEGDKVYKASVLAGIYVMAKVGAKIDGTDAGWVYGTVTPSGQVTSAGRVASCMGCHVDAGADRLFGATPGKPR